MERLLGVKPSIIRYWEKEIPLLQTKKNNQGRRVYASRDMHILLRLKYLLYDRHFTLEGAREQLFRELSGDNQNLKAQIAALRSELTDLYFLVSNKHKSADTQKRKRVRS
jgi:DNA-binding transcriptional MerR regulator